MSMGTVLAENDWAGRPATKADLMLVQGELEGKIKDVEGIIKDLRVELSSDIAKLRVCMVWMTLGVATGLASLITLFQFLS